MRHYKFQIAYFTSSPDTWNRDDVGAFLEGAHCSGATFRYTDIPRGAAGGKFEFYRPDRALSVEACNGWSKLARLVAHL